MFQVEEYIVCGCNGVCKVISIGPLEIKGADKEKLYYTLQPIYLKKSKIYVAVDNDKIISRKIITKAEAEKLIEEIPYIETIWVDDDKKREEVYKESVKKYDCREYVKIIKTLCLSKQKRIVEGKKLSISDQKYLQIAREGLFGEMAIPLNLAKEKVEDYMNSFAYFSN